MASIDSREIVEWEAYFKIEAESMDGKNKEQDVADGLKKAFGYGKR